MNIPKTLYTKKRMPWKNYLEFGRVKKKKPPKETNPTGAYVWMIIYWLVVQV